MINFSKEAKITTALDYVSGTASRDGAGLDMQGYDSVAMIVKFAAIAAGATTSIKAQQSSDDGSSDAYSDLEGTAQTVAADDDNQVFVIDLVRPTKRYVRLVVTKDGANAAAESAIYVQYGAKDLPVTMNVTDEVTAETHVSPAEGTA